MWFDFIRPALKRALEFISTSQSDVSFHFGNYGKQQCAQVDADRHDRWWRQIFPAFYTWRRSQAAVNRPNS